MMPTSSNRPNVIFVFIKSSTRFCFCSTHSSDFVANVFESQLTQFAASEYLIVSYLRKSKRRLGKTVQFIVRFKAYLSQYQSEQIAQKHIDGKLPALEFKPIAILPNLVGFKDGQRFRFRRVEIGVGNYRARQILRISCELLR